MKKPTPSLSLTTLLLVAACNSAPTSPHDLKGRKYELDRVDNTVIVQLYADGF